MGLEEACKDHLLCPNDHALLFSRWNYGKDDSDGLFDADGRPMYEDGLYCFSCKRVYGLSKLRSPYSTEEEDDGSR